MVLRKCVFKLGTQHQQQGSNVMRANRVLAAASGIAALAGLLVPELSAAQQPNTYTVIATGLQAPRGLRFGPDGDLYVAEAGLGGSNSTAGMCTQVPGPPPGPYTGGSTGRISKVSAGGRVTTVAGGFPSAQDAEGDLLGVADVAFLNGDLYALLAAGGCSHGNPNSPSGIARVDRHSGKWTLIADIGAWLKTHPAKFESPDDFEPDGTLYSMIAEDGVLYTVEPNHGQLLAVTPRGAIRQVIDISASQGHIVPTSVAERDGVFYVGNLNLFPIDPQWARVQAIAKGESEDDVHFAPGFSPGNGYHIVSSKAGFTTVVAVDFGPDGLLYALELSDAAGFPTPGAGKVLRVKHSGEIEAVITNLNVPTGMTFGADGRLYISDLGAVPAPTFGIGRILRFDIAPGW
jgi:hypothetical protein